MFMGPLEVSKPWSNAGVEGARKFITRVWNFFAESKNLTDENDGTLTMVYHQTVKKVTEDFEALAFNTAISQLMIFMNAAYKAEKCPKEYAEGIVKLLSPITPHVCEEIWSIFGHNDTIAYESWPVYDEKELVVDTIEIAVQVNGKIKAKIMIPAEAEQAEVLGIAKADEGVASAIDGKSIVKEIYVKGRLVNIVVK
jgi:leucyl-tRNA synthetase